MWLASSPGQIKPSHKIAPKLIASPAGRVANHFWHHCAAATAIERMSITGPSKKMQQRVGKKGNHRHQQRLKQKPTFEAFFSSLPLFIGIDICLADGQSLWPRGGVLYWGTFSGGGLRVKPLKLFFLFALL